MGATRARLVDALWHGADPFATFTQLVPPDMQGWNSDHRFLIEAVDRHQPGVAVEVGVWKGGSVMTMARRMRELGLDGVVIAVDTWLGSAEHWLAKETHGSLNRLHGYPLLYYVFLSNVVAEGLQDYVLPLPLDSANAAAVLTAAKVRPSLMHIDAAHDTPSVVQDLTRWWPLLAPGGTMIVDDYDLTGRVWATVRNGVDQFLGTVAHTNFASVDYKGRFDKPANAP